MFCFHFLLRLDCVRLLQTEKIRTVSEKIKFLFSARGIWLVFGMNRQQLTGPPPARGVRARPGNQIVSIRGNKEVDRAIRNASSVTLIALSTGSASDQKWVAVVR